MTFETFSVLTVNNAGMGQTMTVLAFWYAGVGSFVAVPATDAAVEALRCGKIQRLADVARTAEFSWNISRWNDLQGLMG